MTRFSPRSGTRFSPRRGGTTQPGAAPRVRDPTNDNQPEGLGHASSQPFRLRCVETSLPGALPWAVLSHPFGVKTGHRASPDESTFIAHMRSGAEYPI